MTSKRDLGPILAIVGGVIVLAAVIAGFIVIGGPGDARDQRLDAQTTARLDQVAAMAQCAFALKGQTPKDLAEMRAAIRDALKANPDIPACNRYTLDSDFPGADYTRIADDRIRLCGEFRRSFDPDQQSAFDRMQRYERFPELLAARPSGKHCYDIQLVKPDAAS
ncbi:MAG TPA: hypothetical protein VIA80_19515 [Hyphomonadaceae bacterium]|jgi:hypothetical protein